MIIITLLQLASYTFNTAAFSVLPRNSNLLLGGKNRNFGVATFSATKKDEVVDNEVVDIAIIGAGIGGLCAGGILNTIYGKKVAVFESHYLPGGCAHAFDRTVKITDEGENTKKTINFTFDSGPTIVLGCSKEPFNPLRQVLNAINLQDEVKWIPYEAWGMIENPIGHDQVQRKKEEKRWKLELGPDLFEQGPLIKFGGEDALREFRELKEVTKPLVTSAVSIPAMAMRSGNSAIIPLLRYFPALLNIIQQGDTTTGTFRAFMDGPIYVVKNKWLRNWLNALAFSLSGLPASRTAAAAMAYVLYDMHRPGAALDYPEGGLGAVVDALVKGLEQGQNGSKLYLKNHVESIDTDDLNGSSVTGLTLRGGKRISVKDGVICNAPVWSLNKLIKNENSRKLLNDNNMISTSDAEQSKPKQTWITDSKQENGRSQIRFDRQPDDSNENSNNESLLQKCDTAEQTGSFLHLHVALDSSGLDMDALEAHYTVMDRGLGGDGTEGDGPCGELNMIAVSNPCKLDKNLAPTGYIVVHAYGAGNEPYNIWENMDRNSKEYKQLKEKRAEVLWRAIISVIPDAKERVVSDEIGTPLTHERFLRRYRGTYGSATEDYLKDGRTNIEGLVLCGDGIFPGIGIPAVALSGASAANSFVSPLEQWKCLDKLKSQNKI